MKASVSTIRLLSRLCAAAWILTALPSLAGGLPNVFRDELESKDPLRISKACEKATEYPTPDTVRALIQLLPMEDPSNRTSQIYGDVGYVEPCVYAIKALSKIVPNPPTTFQQKRDFGFFLHYVDLWFEWWEENRHDYEGTQITLPPRPADSILNLPISEREALAVAERERSWDVAAGYNVAWVHNKELTYDEWMVNYIAERQAERAAARAAAKASVAPKETDAPAPKAASPPSSRDPNGDASTPGRPSALWLLLGGIFSVALISIIVQKRRQRRT